MSRSYPARAVLIGGLLLTAAVSAAQTQAQVSAGQALKVASRLVLLDVSVQDAKGRPVDGLTAGDFAVFEDNQPQTVLSVESTGFHALPADLTSATVFDPAEPANFHDTPVTMLVLDEVNTHFADSVYAIDALANYLTAQPATLRQPTTLLVVRDARFEQLAPYTLDRDRLIRALKAHKPEQAWQLEQSMSAGQGVAERLDHSLAALEQLAQYSFRIPGHKNLIWIGAGFPSVDPTSLTPATETQLQHLLQHAADTLLEDRVTLYAVDPTTTAASMTEITDPDQMDFVSAAAEGSGRIVDPFDRSLDFDRLGPLTGGRVIRQRNDVSAQISQSIALGSSYYTLGYRPSSTSDLPGQFRQIRVVCLRSGLTAVTHEGYYTSSDQQTATAADTIAYDLNNAATTSLPLNAVAFQVERASDPTAFLVHVHSSDLTWSEAENNARTASAQILLVALSDKNKILAYTLHTETARAAADSYPQGKEQTVRFTTSLVLPSKTARLRFIVRDQASGRMGTVDLRRP